jgi:hypothetical protein
MADELETATGVELADATRVEEAAILVQVAGILC